MKKILLLMAVAMAFVSCNSYDSYNDMKEKCNNLDGAFGLKIGASKSEIMEYAESAGYTVKKGVPYPIFTYNDRIDVFDLQKECKGNIEWFYISNVNVDNIRQKDKIALTFFKGELVFIEANLGYRDVLTESLKGDYLNVSDNVFSAIKQKYGKGIDMKKSREVSSKYKEYSNFYTEKSVVRYYEGISSFLITEYYDWSNTNSFYNEKTMHILCGVCNYDDFIHIKKVDRVYNYRRKPSMDDKEYQNSLNRQHVLEEMGMDDAAELERKARIRYLEGGGYHSKDGGSQVHFQGSKEQEEQLKQMDEMGW